MACRATAKATVFGSTNEIIDVKPVWLVKLETLCKDGSLHILFFDELTNATKQTQSVIFKIVLERFVNNRWPLPRNARIVAAGNERSESSAAHDLAEPLFGRFAHIYIRTTVENWMPWAIRSRINPFVMEFLANNDLYLRTPYTGTSGYADPRRWEMVSKALDASENDFSLLEPIVGRDSAEAFVRFFRARAQLISLGSYTDPSVSVGAAVPRSIQRAAGKSACPGTAAGQGVSRMAGLYAPKKRKTVKKTAREDLKNPRAVSVRKGYTIT